MSVIVSVTVTMNTCDRERDRDYERNYEHDRDPDCDPDPSKIVMCSNTIVIKMMKMRAKTEHDASLCLWQIVAVKQEESYLNMYVSKHTGNNFLQTFKPITCIVLYEDVELSLCWRQAGACISILRLCMYPFGMHKKYIHTCTQTQKWL